MTYKECIEYLRKPLKKEDKPIVIYTSLEGIKQYNEVLENVLKERKVKYNKTQKQ